MIRCTLTLLQIKFKHLMSLVLISYCSSSKHFFTIVFNYWLSLNSLSSYISYIFSLLFSVIKYPIKIRLSNNGINRPYILRWNFQIVDDSLSSKSPKDFTIDPSKQDSQEVDLIIQSTRPLDKDEIKNMLSFQAIDQSTKQPFLVNNEFIYTPEMVLITSEQDPESLNTDSFIIQP